ncbi:hypothetical protein BKA83DRAFT_4261450 [Pisolithus microcarpus]|nr:hypothetical protein BKA83DRAFT_4261450 [Pisolithus microcarpus]
MTLRTPVSSNTPPGIDEVFLGSCKEFFRWARFKRRRDPIFCTISVVNLSHTAYDFTQLDAEEARAGIFSDGKCLVPFYPNAANDFYGTPSGALCIYKSGDAWPVRTGPESWRFIREARSVHGHPLQPVWCEVGERIYTLLDSKGVRWTSIDPVIFADAGEERFSPLLIWIGVEPKSLPYELANTAAEAVSFLLAEAGFSGIEIGFRESVVTRSVAGPKMLPFNFLRDSVRSYPFLDSIPEFRKPFTPALGLAIAPLKNPQFEGTGALYFRESRDSKRVFCLTCAHVARPLPIYIRNTGLARKTKSHPPEKIIALGRSAYESAVKSMMNAIGELDTSIARLQSLNDEMGEPKEDEPEDTTENRKEHLNLIKQSKKKIDAIYELHGEVTRRWTVPEQRVIGEVVHVEPITANHAPHGFTRDWALIELYNDKFDWDKFPGNRVYLGGNLSFLQYLSQMFPRPEDMSYSKYPMDGLLQASHAVQPHEIHNAPDVDAHGEECLLVVKNGMRTGTTVGRLNGMESFTRVYDENGIKGTSIEIAVLPYGYMKDPFSAPGDSGAIVLDRNGGIVGMLTGGAGVTDNTDVSYLTPYWWLEQEIKKYFPDACLYEVVN